MALRALLAASLLFVAGYCRAQPFAYSAGILPGNDGSQIVYRINLASGSSSALGSVGQASSNVPITSLNNFTFDQSGHLYALGAAQGSTQAALLTINPNSGRNTGVQALSGISSQSTANLSLAFTCDGKLWMADSGGGNLYQVTPATGQTQLIGTLGATITGLATYKSVLYGFGGHGDSNLYTINTGSGAAKLVGAYGTTAANALNAAVDGSGNLWTMLQNVSGSLSSGLPSQSNALGHVNASTGALTSTGSVANPAGWAEPFPVTLLGLAIGPPSCAEVDPPPPPATTVGAPLLSTAALAILILLLFGCACAADSVRARR